MRTPMDFTYSVTSFSVLRAPAQSFPHDFSLPYLDRSHSLPFVNSGLVQSHPGLQILDLGLLEPQHLQFQLDCFASLQTSLGPFELDPSLAPSSAASWIASQG